MADTNAMLSRLSARGVVRVSLEMQPHVIAQWTDENLRQHTQWGSVQHPLWKCSLVLHRRRYPEDVTTRIGAFVYDYLGFNSHYAENVNLDIALDELLQKSSPPRFDPATDYCPGQPIREEDR